jgi:hypothetical protein
MLGIHDQVDRGDFAALDCEQERGPNLSTRRPDCAGRAVEGGG